MKSVYSPTTLSDILGQILIPSSQIRTCLLDVSNQLSYPRLVFFVDLSCEVTEGVRSSPEFVCTAQYCTRSKCEYRVWNAIDKEVGEGMTEA